MSKVDWSKAPEDATHYGPATPDWNACWMKKVGGEWHGWLAKYDTKWGYLTSATHDRARIASLIERPKQPQAWSGPEDGLPPVGTVCEARILLPGQSNYLWRRCEVVYRNDEMSQSELLVVDIEKTTARWADEFRAIKTEEDIASDKRESAIRELMDIAQVDCRVTAARLVDAGFKREGV